MSTFLVAESPSPSADASQVAPAQSSPAMAVAMPHAAAARSNSRLLSIGLVILAVLVLGYYAVKAVSGAGQPQYPVAGARVAGDGGMPYFGR